MIKKVKKRKRKSRRWVRWNKLPQETRDAIDHKHYFKSIADESYSTLRKNKRGRYRETNDFFSVPSTPNEEVYDCVVTIQESTLSPTPSNSSMEISDFDPLDCYVYFKLSNYLFFIVSK